MKRFIRLSLTTLALCSSMALQNDYVFGMFRDVNMPCAEELNLKYLLEQIQMMYNSHPSYFDGSRLADLINRAATQLSEITHLDYFDAQQIIVNNCLHNLIINSTQMTYENDAAYIHNIISSGADVNSFYNPAAQNDPQHKMLPQSADCFGHNQTPLMLAVQTMNTDAITLLRNNNADLLLKDNAGNTALILAVKNRSAQSFNMVKALVDPKGAANHVSFPEALQIAKEEEWQKCPTDILDFCVRLR